MASYLQIEKAGKVATVRLNRPDKHNAFDEHLIAELTQAFRDLASDAAVRVVVLAANGQSFSAGADLDWMRRMSQYSHDENRADAMKLATMLRTIHECPKPVIARVHGPAFAGGMGLVAACEPLPPGRSTSGIARSVSASTRSRGATTRWRSSEGSPTSLPGPWI